MANTKITSRVIADNAVTSSAIADGAITASKIASDAIDIVADTTPQLGGDLDLNSNNVTGTGNINITGTIQSSGNITGTLATAAQPNITSVGTLTGFTSTGIDDNADATAITIDSDENILIGTNTLDAWYTSTNAGVNITNASNFIAVARSGGVPFIANRLSSDGDIMEFKKDGAAIGTIGNISTRMYIGSGDTGIFFDSIRNQVQPNNPSTGSGIDATIDLGRDVFRFKDLYLSGGAYLGGTGAANKLDDYEEGTWTPTLTASISNPSVTYVSPYTQGQYTKIGNIVHVNFEIRYVVRSGGSGNALISGLPFARLNGYPDGDKAGGLDFYGVSFPTPNITFAYLSLGTNGTSMGMSFNRSATTPVTLPIGNVGLVSGLGYIRGNMTYRVS